MNSLTFGIFALAVSICSAAPSSQSDHASKQLLKAAFSTPPASFETRFKAGRIHTELCFDRCYQFDGDSRHSNEYWDALVVLMGTVGNWNVPDDFKQKLSNRLGEVQLGAAVIGCGKPEHVSCIGRDLAASTGLKAWEVNYDEGNACVTKIDIDRTLKSLAVVTSGSTHCRKVAK